MPKNACVYPIYRERYIAGVYNLVYLMYATLYIYL
jgi:hypothetical protein